MMEPSLATSNPIDEFLIAEYQSVLDRSLKFEEVKANRINFFLFLVGAIAAGLGSVFQISFVQANIYPIGIGLTGFLGIIGWQTIDAFCTVFHGYYFAV